MQKEAVKPVKKVVKKTKSIDGDSKKIMELYEAIVGITKNLDDMKRDIARLKIRIGLWV